MTLLMAHKNHRDVHPVLMMAFRRGFNSAARLDCPTLADVTDARPLSPGSPRKKRNAQRAAQPARKETAPSATCHVSQKRIARARVRRSVTRSASHMVGGACDTGPGWRAAVFC